MKREWKEAQLQFYNYKSMRLYAHIYGEGYNPFRVRDYDRLIRLLNNLEKRMKREVLRRNDG